MKLLIGPLLFLLLLALVRRGVLQVDLSFPWFLAIAVLALASTSDRFIALIARSLGVVYEPIAVLMLVIFALLGVLTTLSIGLSLLRLRHIRLLRRMVSNELAVQEARLSPIEPK